MKNIFLSSAIAAQINHPKARNNSFGNYNKQALEDRAYNSPLAHALRKKNKQESLYPQDAWAKEYKRSQTKLSMLMIIYMFSQDDGQLSSKEMKSIKKFIKSNSSYFSPSDVELAQKFEHDLPDANYVLTYVESNNIKKELFMDSINSLSKIVKNDDTYRNLLRTLKDQFMY